MKQLPNILTATRIILIPVIVGLMLLPDSRFATHWAAILFGIASITDFFDGWVARHYHVESVMGKFLDPVADKLLVLSALVMLVPTGRIHALVVIIIIGRDLLIGGIRTVAASDGIVIPAGMMGKIKTNFQMFSVAFLIAHFPHYGFPWRELGLVGIYISLVLALLSGFMYLRDFWKVYKDKLLA